MVHGKLIKINGILTSFRENSNHLVGLPEAVVMSPKDLLLSNPKHTLYSNFVPGATAPRPHAYRKAKVDTSLKIKVSQVLVKTQQNQTKQKIHDLFDHKESTQKCKLFSVSQVSKKD